MEFEIKGVKYRVAKLSVFDQLKVTRKLLPVLAGMMSDFGSIRSRLPADGKIDTVKFEQLKPVFETMLPRIAEELSSLTEDGDYSSLSCGGIAASYGRMGASIYPGRTDV